MRRAIITIGGTVAGLAALLAFKSHPVADASAAGRLAPRRRPRWRPAPARTRPAQRPAGAERSAGSATSPRRLQLGVGVNVTAARRPPRRRGRSPARWPTRSTAPCRSSSSSPASGSPRSTSLQQTDNGQESSQIDSFAIPKLTSETLTAQSARIDAVSGAIVHQPGLHPVSAERARPGPGVTSLLREMLVAPVPIWLLTWAVAGRMCAHDSLSRVLDNL